MKSSVLPGAPSRAAALSRLRRAAVLAVALPTVALLVAVTLLYRQAYQDAEHTLHSAVGIAREHALKLFDTNEMLLARMLDVLGPGGDAEWLARSRELHERLKTMAAGLPQVQGLFVMGTEDRMLGSDRVFPPPRHIDYSDREFVRVHRSTTGPRLFFTEQLVSRATGEHFFNVSRRRSFPDGSYAGTLSVSLRPEYFDAFWQQMAQASPGLRLALVRADGRLIARWPGVVPEGAVMPPAHPLLHAITRGDTEGLFHAQSAFENVARVSAFLKLGEHPVYVIASFNRRDILAAWASRAGLLALFTVPLIAALGWMARLDYRRTREELLAAERLQDESARREHAELAQELLRREKAALEQTDRAKDEFIAMLSHELRNPLAALTSAAEVLRAAPAREEAATKARDVIQRQTRHMTRLIEDLLDVNRVVMGKAALVREPMNLADAVRRAIEAMRAAGRLGGHDVHLALQPAWADADRARMEQIAVNLLDNALKFTPRGKRIDVRVAQDDSHAVLSVHDEGDGIRAEMLASVFDVFVQGEHGLDRARGGLGIGLALVKRLAEQHGGSVSAESAGPGRGATFTLRLPAVPARSERPAAPGPRRPAGARRILVVEDNDDVRESLRAALALMGHDVHAAPNGLEALGVADRARPEVAIIDLGLPDIDGFEVARRLRASSTNGRVALIALTGYGQSGDTTRAMEAGFEVHLVKPVAAERLAAVMAEFA